MDTPIEICEERDVKGLYKKARAGEIKGQGYILCKKIYKMFGVMIVLDSAPLVLISVEYIRPCTL